MASWKGLQPGSNSPYQGMTKQGMVDMKRAKRMAQVDSYPSEVRALVHDYGLSVVRAIYDLGVRKPQQIKHIVETVLNEFSPTRGISSSQGTRATQPGGEPPQS